ncbi:MAG: sulfate ABC transporter substrate-binding protein, partial [Betaproteobacteria bacterium]
MKFIKLLSGVIVGTLLSAAVTSAHADVALLNVSYDPTRELYQDFNAAFAKYWKAKAGQDVT